MFWNVPELERNSVLKFVRPYSEETYDESVVFEESEMINYRMSTTDKPHLDKGIINIADDADVLVKYAFSNAISSSVKLGSWESSLEELIDSIASLLMISEEMLVLRCRRSLYSRRQERFWD